jgi:hypothetical protein
VLLAAENSASVSSPALKRPAMCPRDAARELRLAALAAGACVAATGSRWSSPFDEEKQIVASENLGSWALPRF